MKLKNKHINQNGDAEYTAEMQMPIWASQPNINENGDEEITIYGAVSLCLLVPEERIIPRHRRKTPTTGGNR